MCGESSHVEKIAGTIHMWGKLRCEKCVEAIHMWGFMCRSYSCVWAIAIHVWEIFTCKGYSHVRAIHMLMGHSHVVGYSCVRPIHMQGYSYSHVGANHMWMGYIHVGAIYMGSSYSHV